MQAIGRCLTWFVLSLACVSACEKSKASSKPSAGRDAATPSAVATPSAAPAPSAPPGAAEPRAATRGAEAKPACRALAVTGVVTVDGVPLATAGLVDGAHWVELAAGSSVALRHTQTSREFKLLGPARALPCRDGSEQILLAEGQLVTSKNLGVRPGAEVLIATPEGVVRYGDAALDLELGAKGLRVRVKQGEAWVEPEERGKPRFDNPVRSGTEVRLPRTLPKAQALVDACQSAAETAEGSARRVLGSKAPGANESLGARAAAHMRERSKARMACAIAAAAAFSEGDPAIRQKLSGSVARADELWQSVPHAPR
jgi:hypothetical protein